MSDMFSRASETFVWLENDELRANDIQQLLSIVASAGNCLSSAVEERPQYDPLPLETTKLSTIRGSIWDAVMQFYQRECFERLWVIQEVNLASGNQVICSKLSILWSDHSMAAQFLSCSRAQESFYGTCQGFEPTRGRMNWAQNAPR